jgi:ubiquinone/menaquinone biosynthesis C-methylase UbiE
MTSTKAHWENIHNTDITERSIANHTHFAKEASSYLSRPSKILELGCGVGNDALYFASQGHLVMATDFSDNVIRKNNEKHPNVQNVSFSTVNILDLASLDNKFDMVYAHLSLHYFFNEDTQNTFKNISSVLNEGGRIAFLCKSIHDPLYGQGNKLENDMYELNGHVRHFFSREYVSNLLANRFTILLLEESEAEFYGVQSAFVKCIARKN